MKFRVLGCSSTIGGGSQTSSYLIDDDILIDAGTGVSNLSLDALEKIDHIFLTHSHLDHIACLPLISDAVSTRRAKPITIHARPQTLELLRRHVLNWKIWPDFTEIPTPQTPFMTLKEMAPGDNWEHEGRRIHSVSVNHTVPAVGYLVSTANECLALSGDTTVTDEFWEVVNGCENTRYLVLETTFPDKEFALATLSKHLCPSMVQGELKKLHLRPEIYITHMMPDDRSTIMAELNERNPDFTIKPLEADHVFELN